MTAVANPFSKGSQDHEVFESIAELVEQVFLAEAEAMHQDLKQLITSSTMLKHVDSLLLAKFEQSIWPMQLQDGNWAVISTHNKLSQDVYYDAGANSAYSVSDVAKMKLTAAPGQNIPALDSFGQELHSKISEYFRKFAAVPTAVNVVPTREGFTVLSASTFVDNKNKYSSSSAREYKLTAVGSDYKLSGTLTFKSHFFEESNAALNAALPLKEKTFPKNGPVSAIVKYLESHETELVMKFSEDIDTADVQTFKLLRMPVPYTKNNINFEQEFLRIKGGSK